MNALCILMLCLGGNVYDDFFERGNTAYAAGDMAAAVSAYEELVASGVENAEVFYNLGSAFYHLGDPGRAVLNYERAVGLDRDFDAAQRALAIAVAATVHARARPVGFALDGRGPTVLPGLSQRMANRVALVFWWLAWGILAVGLLAGGFRRKNFAVTAAAGLAMVALALVSSAPAPHAAVVLASDTLARYGPHPRDAVRMALAPGDRVLVDRQSGGWARVETADGHRGWVEVDRIALLGPPYDSGALTRESNIP